MEKVAGFGNLPEKYTEYTSSEIVVVPVPYDETSTWIKGADNGPGAIIEASGQMELYDIETESEVYRRGIFTDVPVTETGSPESMVRSVEERVLSHLKQNKFVVTLGGEHSISIGAVRAHNDHCSGLSVLQLDAHADLRDEYEGSKYNHACVMARVKELCPCVQAGIRSMEISEKNSMDRSRVFFMEDVRRNRNWAAEAVKLLTEKVYLTIDLDVFDTSIMPATGTPEPGGLLWYDVLDLVKEVTRNKTIVGLDIVELCPGDHSKHCDFLAAKLAYKILSYRYMGG